MENLETVALTIYEAIFGNQEIVEIADEQYQVQRTSRAKLRFIRIKEYMFLEQNPAKGSRWGKMAREGHNILWVLLNNAYHAQVRDMVSYICCETPRTLIIMGDNTLIKGFMMIAMFLYMP
jgi:hypothetical protein